MRRTKPLKTNVDKVRAWNQKHRGGLDRRSSLDSGGEGMRSTELRRRAAVVGAEDFSRPRSSIARTKGRRKAKIPVGARKTAKARSRGICVRPGCDNRIDQLHHVLPEEKWPDLAKFSAVLVGVCAPCHAQHENAYRRLPFEALPQCTLDLAQVVGPRAQAYVERTYPRLELEAPPPGGSRPDERRP